MKKILFMGMAALMLFSCEKKNEVYNAEPMGAPATKGACDAEEQAIVDGLRDRMVVFSSVEDYLAKADELSGDMDVDYDALMAWKAANRCVLPGVEGELSLWRATVCSAMTSMALSIGCWRMEAAMLSTTPLTMRSFLPMLGSVISSLSIRTSWIASFSMKTVCSSLEIK